MAAICLASTLAPFMGSSYNLALPDISVAFSMKAVTLTWFNTGYLLATAIFQIPFARMADMFGRKKFFIVGLLGVSLTTLISPLAPNAIVFIALRFFSGVASAMTFATSMAILMVVIPPALRAKAIAVNTTFVYGALAAGPIVGGFMVEHLGWQSLFFLSAFMAFGVTVLAFAFMKGEWITAAGEKFDYLGSLLYALGLSGVIYGFTKLPHLIGFTFIALGSLFFIIFICYEKQAKAPVLNIRLFSTNRIFLFATLAALINYSANSSTIFMLSLYLRYIKGYEASFAGIILISQALVQSFAAMSTGRLSARIAPSTLATIGMLITAAGLLGMVFVDETSPIWMIIVLLAFLGGGFGIFSSPNMNVIMSSVDKASYGQASATTGTARLTGQSFSMGISAMCISFFVGNREIVPELFGEFMQSFRLSFIVFAALCFVGVYASLMKNKYLRVK